MHIPSKFFYVIGLILFGCGSDSTTVNSEDLNCDLTISWRAPTEYEDGSPLTTQEIKKFTVNRYNEAQTTIVNVDVDNPQAVSWHFYNLPSGSMSFRVNVTSTNEALSDWSNVRVQTFVAACG
jgi:hypothetical protein